jgi:hypothetical protein
MSNTITLASRRRFRQRTAIALAAMTSVAPVFAASRTLNAPAAQSATADPFVGCWRTVGGPAWKVDANGTVTMAQVTGKWRRADAAKGTYVLTWPEIQDTAVLSADDKTLVETNPWFTLTATRISGGTGIVGMWQWPGTLVLAIKPDGTFSAGPIAGRWKAAGLERTYTLTWPGPIHTGTLAADGQKMTGADQYGNQFAAGKEACP